MDLKKHLQDYSVRFEKVLIIFTISFLFAQLNAQKADSLKIVLKNCSNLEQKAKIYNKISNIYLDIDLNSTKIYADSALNLGQELNNFHVVSNAYVNYANAYYFKGNLDSTLYFYQKSYEEITKTDDKNEIL